MYYDQFFFEDQVIFLCSFNTIDSIELCSYITPASAAAVSGANFATAKFRDAYGSPLEAIVM